MASEKERIHLMPTHTKDVLAKELRNLGLEEMATEAERGEYHDFLSPFPFPEMRLVRNLASEATKYPDEAKQAEIMALRRRVMDGEFDASTEESDQWASSPEGQETLSSLIPKGKSDEE
jgi:hypothetical protein